MKELGQYIKMKINNSTPEQDFIINSLVNDYLDGIVASFKKASVAQPINKFSAISDKLSSEDAQLFLDIAAKY